MNEFSVKSLLVGLEEVRELLQSNDVDRALLLCDELLAAGGHIVSASACHLCGGAATKLCDFRLGGPIGGYEDGPQGRYPVFDSHRMPYTCDMPMCDACATPRGRSFISGPAPGTDTIDYCPTHANHQRRVGDMKPITPEVAAAARAKAWASARPLAVVHPLFKPSADEE